MKREQIITEDPEILGGTPVLSGTRVPVDSLLAHLRAGESLDDFLEWFPSVRREKAEAFLDLALTVPARGRPHARVARRESGLFETRQEAFA